MKKTGNVIVRPRHPRESADRMIRRFIKKTKKERIVEEARDRRRYKKPSVKLKEKFEAAAKRRVKARYKVNQYNKV